LALRTEKPKIGYGLALLAGFFLSLISVVGKEALKLGVDPLTLSSLRATFTAVIVVVTLMLTDRQAFRIERRDLTLFLVYGFVGIGLNYFLYFYALQVTTVAISITLLYTYTALVVIFAFFIYRERVTRTKVIALGVTFLGVALIALYI